MLKVRSTQLEILSDDNGAVSPELFFAASQRNEEPPVSPAPYAVQRLPAHFEGVHQPDSPAVPFAGIQADTRGRLKATSPSLNGKKTTLNAVSPKRVVGATEYEPNAKAVRQMRRQKGHTRANTQPAVRTRDSDGGTTVHGAMAAARDADAELTRMAPSMAPTWWPSHAAAAPAPASMHHVRQQQRSDGNGRTVATYTTSVLAVATTETRGEGLRTTHLVRPQTSGGVEMVALQGLAAAHRAWLLGDAPHPSSAFSAAGFSLSSTLRLHSPKSSPAGV